MYGVSDRLGSIENGKIPISWCPNGDLFDEKTKITGFLWRANGLRPHEPKKPKDAPRKASSENGSSTYTTTPEGARRIPVDLEMASDGTLSGTTTSKRGTAQLISGLSERGQIQLQPLPFPSGESHRRHLHGTFDGTTE